MKKNFLISFVALAGAVALSGCTTTGQAFTGMTSKSPAKTVMAEMATIQPVKDVLACVRPSTKGKRVAIPVAMDNTGKTNSVSDAGTGNFLPGAQTSNAVIKLLQDAGMEVMSLNSVNGEAVLRQFVTPEKARQMQIATSRNMPDYYLDFSPLTLDFDKTRNASLMVKGLGVYSDMQRATISGGTKLVKADGSLSVVGYGDMKLSVYSTQSGLMLGRVFGNTLATGEAGAGFQQPMQLWTAEYILNLTAAMALADLPGVPARCGQMMNKIVKPDVVTM